MIQSALRFGIQKAAMREVSPDDMRATVGQHIEHLLAESPDRQLSAQIRSAIKDPQSIIEIRSGKLVQAVTPDMPLRELLPPESAQVEITVSKPHVGG